MRWVFKDPNASVIDPKVLDVLNTCLTSKNRSMGRFAGCIRRLPVIGLVTL